MIGMRTSPKHATVYCPPAPGWVRHGRQVPVSAGVDIERSNATRRSTPTATPIPLLAPGTPPVVAEVAGGWHPGCLAGMPFASRGLNVGEGLGSDPPSWML